MALSENKPITVDSELPFINIINNHVYIIWVYIKITYMNFIVSS